MATIVRRMPNIKRSKYMPLFSGKVWKLVRGVDFEGTIQQHQVRIVNAARFHGFRVITRSEGDSLFVQRVS